MTKAAETQAARVERRLKAIYPEADGYDIVVYVDGHSICSSVYRDDNAVHIYTGDRWQVSEIVTAAAAEIDKLDRDEQGNPARDEDGAPLELSVY